jgi:dihydroxy-acid dehydratase
MAGGFPLEYNTLSLCPGQTLPNRNALALETESVFLSEPADAAVFICTCDKDVPAMLMAAARIDIPSIFVLGGTMYPGRWLGRDVVCCTDQQRADIMYRAGEINADQYEHFYNVAFPTCGACGPLGTANTMQCMTEALGMCLPGAATTPAPHFMLARNAEQSGVKIVELLEKDYHPSNIMTEEAFNNAIRVLMAMGGSTNAVIHLMSIARQLGIDIPLDRFDQISRQTPFIVNVKPSGTWAVADLHEEGGVRTVMKQIEPLLDTGVKTVTGQSLADNLRGPRPASTDKIRTLDNPIFAEGGLAVIRGNLAPTGAIIKTSAAADRALLQHSGPAVVFESGEEAHKTLANRDLDLTPDHVMVLRNMGPKAACMPERGALPLPYKVARTGAQDMMRVTDCRMSGTQWGTVVLHVSPESYVGGPLAAVNSGDIVELDLEHRRLALHVPDEEVKRRLAAYVPPAPKYDYETGPLALWYQLVEQADRGCLYPFMKAKKK